VPPPARVPARRAPPRRAAGRGRTAARSRLQEVHARCSGARQDRMGGWRASGRTRGEQQPARGGGGGDGCCPGAARRSPARPAVRVSRPGRPPTWRRRCGAPRSCRRRAATIGCSAGGVIGGGAASRGPTPSASSPRCCPTCGSAASTSRSCAADAGAAVVGMPEHDEDDGRRAARRPVQLPGRRLRSPGQRRAARAARVGRRRRRAARAQARPGCLVDGRVVDRGAVGVLLKGAGVRTS
jgi:hypothetical protein